MASGFRMNPNFPREISRQLQKIFDRVFDRYAGQPVETVKAALKREGFEEADGNDLDTLASAISAGQRVKVKAA